MMLANIADSEVPIVVSPATIASVMMLAINAYSIAVVPRSSRTNAFR
jgi:hypothetical protein